MMIDSYVVLWYLVVIMTIMMCFRGNRWYFGFPCGNLWYPCGDCVVIESSLITRARVRDYTNVLRDKKSKNKSKRKKEINKTKVLSLIYTKAVSEKTAFTNNHKGVSIMDLTLEELFELAGTVSDALGIEFGLKRTDSGWYAQFIGISKRDNIFTTKSGPHDTVNEALIAGLKAVRPLRDEKKEKETAEDRIWQLMEGVKKRNAGKGGEVYSVNDNN